MKRSLIALATVLTAALCAALPLTWRADWPDAKPVETLVHRGTDIELQPTWYINGQEANPSNWTFTTYCQTNAVGPWFGPLPGAAFSHTNDVGAAFYNVMVRAQTPGGQVNYTAFARLRMLDSPGFAPGELPLPVPFIDFSKVVALHAPWTLQADFSSATNTLSAAIGGLAQNLATNYFTAAETKERTDEAKAIGGYATEIATRAYQEVKIAAITNELQDASITALSNTTATINSKIPSAASASNQLADKQWIDDEIDTYAAYYITYTAAGAAFPTRAALTNATVVYSGGVARTPTRNDYAVVLADETHGGAEWRYIYTVAAGATSGQWDAQYPIETNDYDGLSNKPQINGHTLSGNQTGADLGVLDLSGGTVTLSNGIFAVGYDDYCHDTGFVPCIAVDMTGVDPIITIGDDYKGHGGAGVTNFRNPVRFRDYASVDFEDGFTTYGYRGNHEVYVNGHPQYVDYALVTEVSAAALAATNYTNASISPTSPAFSNAVLSVGLGIDTNTVAAINELVDSAHDLPVTGATSVGALLVALAAAVAALKKRLPYALVAKTIENGAVTLDDRASNAVDISATLSPNTLTVNFPAATSGKVRDFALRLNIASGVTAPELVLPQGVVCENADGEVPEISDGGMGGSSTILYFSETENNGTTAKFLLKGETLAAITQA